MPIRLVMASVYWMRGGGMGCMVSPGPQKRGTGGTRQEHRVPPPILWTQNPCFLEVTRRVALQNIENNEVPCKIFLTKELRDVSASTGRFLVEGGAKKRCQDVIEGR